MVLLIIFIAFAIAAIVIAPGSNIADDLLVVPSICAYFWVSVFNLLEQTTVKYEVANHSGDELSQVSFLTLALNMI